MITSSLDRTEHGRHFLPFIQEDRLCESGKGGVGIGGHNLGFSRHIQANDAAGVAGGRGGLAHSPRPYNRDSRQCSQQFVNQLISETRQVFGHGPSAYTKSDVGFQHPWMSVFNAL